TDPAELDKLVREFNRQIGLDRLRCLHVNDSKTPLGSNRDRHDNIGDGLMGEKLGVFLGYPKLQGLPALLEVPGSGHGPDAEQIEVDVDPEHVLHAADVGVAELLVGVEERTAPFGAGAGVDDLVAVNLAAAAFDFVLRPKGELARPGRRLLTHAHTWIVGAMT